MEYSDFNSLETFVNTNSQNNMPQNMPQNMPTNMPQNMPTNMPQNMPQNIPKNMNTPLDTKTTEAAIQHALDNNKLYNNKLYNNLGMNQNQNQNQNALNMLEQKDEKKSPVSVKLFGLGIIISLSVACALAWNEVARYYIGRSIKFYNGKPIYYVIYSMSVTILTFIMYWIMFNKYN